MKVTFATFWADHEEFDVFHRILCGMWCGTRAVPAEYVSQMYSELHIRETIKEQQSVLDILAA